MTELAQQLFAALILVIVTDGVAAGFAARNCWRLRKRAQLAWPLTVFMGLIALTDLSDLVNSLVHGSARRPDSLPFIQALTGRAIRSAATWYLALKLMNGYSRQHQEEGKNAITATTPNQAGSDNPGPTGP